MIKICNKFLIKYFLENNQIPKDILLSASKSGNIELIKFILNQEGIDIKAKDASLYYQIFISHIYLTFKSDIWKLFEILYITLIRSSIKAKKKKKKKDINIRLKLFNFFKYNNFLFHNQSL